LKSKNSKQIIVSYTPERFLIYKVTNKHGTLERKRYMLENADGFVLKNHKGNDKYFYASELIRSDTEYKPDIAMSDALLLNGVETNKTDVLYEEPEENE